MFQILQPVLWCLSIFAMVVSIIILARAIRLLNRINKIRQKQHKQLTRKEVSDG